MAGNGKVAVLGAGSWGTALAAHLAGKGYQIGLWSRRPDQVEQLNASRENSRYLPGVRLAENILVTSNLERILSAVEYVVFSVPSHSFRQVLADALPYIAENALVINTAKGIEENSLQRMSEVFIEVAGTVRAKNYTVLSGPSHAEEVALKMPTAVVIAAVSNESAARVQDLFMTDTFRVYTNPDIIGVELGGALKNIIALGTGIVDGLIGSDNTKAALMTRGLAEITRLGMAMHANPLTFAGLAGLGDLIVTCTSKHSRNRRAGIEIGKGKSLEQALAGVNMVVEGVRTTRATRGLARTWGVEMPITEQMYQVLFEGKSPGAAVVSLMNRDKTHEVEEVALAKIKWWIEKDDKNPV
ncbi:NAD(P)H-dependent glycerol-3-phosphate dehydrogenase [Desulfotruncus alcoholivorax]|uniref:NAD(P)H-dependent glycerol-3-phosphate dehydrogenase n=1 Tax=Desulfotruncus alcoholivorax TaxID=265477 RepID=UPI0003F9A36C|nr:NAD(P)H-dependent glycerol-3-phosphate dehydrogenase [Desulfotruncus alcoholivorax]